MYRKKERCIEKLHKIFPPAALHPFYIPRAIVIARLNYVLITLTF